MKRDGNKKRIVILSSLTIAMIMMLSGCRMRIISDPMMADVILDPLPLQQLRSEEETSDETEIQEEVEDLQPPEETTEEEQTVKNSEAPTPTENPNSSQRSNNSSLGSQGNRSQRGSTGSKEEQKIGIQVTYDPNGGEGGNVSKVVEKGQTYGHQPEVSRRGYGFDGWWTAPAGGNQITPETMVEKTENHTLYAHWIDKRTWTLTLDPVEGRLSSKDSKLEIGRGDQYGTLPTPLREGYDFLGWFTSLKEGEAITPDTVFTNEDDTTLYAQWEYNPEKYWAFFLTFQMQKVYTCQRPTAYFETQQDHITAQWVSLLEDTCMKNIARDRDDVQTEDHWVKAKFPSYVVKGTDSIHNAASIRSAMKERIPDAKVVVVSNKALHDGPEAVYTKLALAKYVFPVDLREVDLDLVARELQVNPAELISTE